MSDSLDAYLVLSGILFAIGTFGFLARRNAISMLMSIELMLNAVNLSIVAFGAFIPELGRAGLGHRADGHGRGGRRGDGRAGHRHRHLPQPADAARRRVRRDAPVSPESLLPLLVILPLAGFAFTALIGRRLGKQAHWIPVLADPRRLG